MKYYDIMDKEEEGFFISFETYEQAQNWLDKQEDRFYENSVRYGMHIVENERSTTSERNDKAFAIANNAICSHDNSDYLNALYEVCKTLNSHIEDELIGSKYINE